jgi:hypothetical protein
MEYTPHYGPTNYYIGNLVGGKQTLFSMFSGDPSEPPEILVDLVGALVDLILRFVGQNVVSLVGQLLRQVSSTTFKESLSTKKTF